MSQMITFIPTAEDLARIIAREDIGEFQVSTVSLKDGRPYGADFETMVFKKGSFRDIAMHRYRTREEAGAGHVAMVERVKAGEFK